MLSLLHHSVETNKMVHTLPIIRRAQHMQVCFILLYINFSMEPNRMHCHVLHL